MSVNIKNKDFWMDLLKNYNKIIIFLIVFVITLCIFLNYDFLFKKKEIEVVFLDVGQGDSELILAENGTSFLIDTGPNANIIALLEKKLSRVSFGLGGVLLTHQDMDHVGAFSDINKEILIKKVFVSKNYTEKLDFSRVFNVSQGDVLKIGNTNLEIISPKLTDVGSTNHTSVVSVLKYGQYRFIFMADADKEIERSLLSQGYFKDGKDYIDILKLGHHGSETASSEAFLKTLKPEYCIFSVGKGNSYNLPSKSVLDLSEKYCKSIYRTDEEGSVGFSTNGKVLKIKKSL